MTPHEEHWIALAQILGPRSHQLRPLLAHFDGPEAVFAADEAAIRAALPDVVANTLSAILEKQTAKQAREIALWCHRNGIRVLTYDSAAYPACLREIDEPPALLYCRGNLPVFDNRLCLGVVGSRRTDAYGERVAYKLSFEMAAAGAVIVSGLAEGIDAFAAAGALNAGGETVAVLGCGIDMIYPKKNTALAVEVAACGTILSEYPPGTKPYAWNFPIRNRIISALSNAVLVVEAGESSGALITARYALMQGKALFAVPGDVTNPRSAGTNRLIRDGAMLALGAQDMLSYFRFLYGDAVQIALEAVSAPALTPEALRRFDLDMTQEPKAANGAPCTAPRRTRAERRQTKEEAPAPKAPKAPVDTSPLTPRQSELFAMLPDGPFSVDVLTAGGIAVSEAAATVTIFELYGLIHSIPGGMFEKTDTHCVF